MTCKPKVWNKFKSFGVITTAGFSLFSGVNLYTGDEEFYHRFVMPTMRWMISDAERAHTLAIRLASWGLVPNSKFIDPPQLKTVVWNREFTNPIGLAAGFDKNAEAVSGLARMGFGFLELGSITPKPQPGNEPPRVFRLVDDRAVINRYGFNSVGHVQAKKNLSQSRPPSSSGLSSVLVGVNLGKNKTSEGHQDFLRGLEYFTDSMGGNVDYFVINVSSPNTPGLRTFQTKRPLEQLIDELLQTKAKLHVDRPVLLKISCDLSQAELADIASVVLKKNRASKSPTGKIDGLIISNTTVSRPSSLKSPPELVAETGGLSGEPLKPMATDCIRQMYKLTGGQLPIIGVGGVATGQDAYEKICAGASLIQIYTALTYEGPPVVNKIKRELMELLREDGFDEVSQAVGADHKKK